MASASYWVVSSNSEGIPSAFMWKCDVGDGMGLSDNEPGVVEDMNAHMAKKHPQSDYVAPPIPE